MTGITESITFAVDNAMLDNEVVNFRAVLKDVVDMDPLWYKGRVFLARTMRQIDYDAAMFHIEKAIAISESQDDDPIHALFLQWEFLIGAHSTHQF